MRGTVLDAAVVRALYKLGSSTRGEVSRAVFSRSTPDGPNDRAVSRALVRLERAELVKRLGEKRWTAWRLTRSGLRRARKPPTGR